MTTNPTFEYQAAELRYQKARTLAEKMEALKDMISKAPDHKSADNLQRQLRHRLGKLKAETIRQKKQKTKAVSLSVKKEGFQIAIIGFPNTGKSTLLTKLTNATPKIADYPFTTKEPEVGMMEFEGAQVQMVEIPALIEGAAEKQAEFLAIVANADGVILLADDDWQRSVISDELKKAKVQKQILACSKDAFPDKKQIFDFFRLIRVYTKEPNRKKSEDKPIVLRQGATVMGAAAEIHKDFVRKFKFARIWGSSKFGGQRVEKNHVLKDRDIIEFHLSN